MDWVRLPPVGGLKWINVNWNVTIARRGVCHMNNQLTSCNLCNTYVEMATSGPWSMDETRALLDM